MTSPFVVDDLNAPLEPREALRRPAPVGVVMADPAHFDVEYVINPHMEGQLHNVDRVAARAQWQALREVYARLGYEVHLLGGVPGLPDLVFTANQSFPAQLPDGRWVAVMSNMRSPHRTDEVAILEAFYASRDATTLRLAHPELHFEGCGDCRWHPDRQLIYGGYGFRTQRAAIDDLATLLQLPVVALELVDPNFYHLDTCLCPLTETAALYVPEAFTERGRAQLARCFPTLLPVPYAEALGFAANGICPDGRHFIVHRDNPHTVAAVTALGLQVIELDTSEFLKSGGSVFCMTLMLP